jgi:hypothetical protein
MDLKSNEVFSFRSAIDDSIDFFDVVSPKLVEHSSAKSPYEFLKYVNSDKN